VWFMFDYWDEWTIAVVNLVNPFVLGFHHVVVCLQSLVRVSESNFRLHFFCDYVV